MLFFDKCDDLNTHYNFTFSKSIGEKLLNGQLRLVVIKMIHQHLIRILHKPVICFGLELEAPFRNISGHQGWVDEESVVNYWEEAEGYAVEDLPLLHRHNIFNRPHFFSQFLKICANITLALMYGKIHFWFWNHKIFEDFNNYCTKKLYPNLN